mgnify:FL=1
MKNKSKGRIGLGVFVGSIVLFFIGVVPVIGALIAGVVTGLIARGIGRGLVAGFITGIIGAVMLTIMISVLGAMVGNLFDLAGLGWLIGSGIGMILIGLSLVQGIICAFGGLIGGAINRR